MNSKYNIFESGNLKFKVQVANLRQGITQVTLSLNLRDRGIGSLIFVWFLEKNGHQLNEKGERKVNDNTLVTLALAVAQSLPEQRDTVQKLIMNLIKN